MINMNSHLPILNRICEEVHQKSSMASKKDNDENDSEIKIDWDCNVEMLLFYAMLGLKPVGVNRHFMMMCIHQRFSDILNKEIPSKLIWDYLDSLYDMAALHESEIIPFPNEEVDYELPTNYYDLAADQLGVTLQNPDEESNDSKSEFNLKSAKKANSSKSKQNGTPVPTSKNVFLTPVSGKSIKQTSSKSETKTSNTTETNVKVKQESPFPAKSNKVKRSASPFPTKSSKTEQSSVSKDDTETPPPKKIKTEHNTPVSSKKTPKAENNNSSKKSSKQDLNSTSKQKSETSENVLKKVKNEKDLSKKNKASSSTENSASKKSSKSETKKPDEVSNKKSDSTSSKHKSDYRSSSVSSKGSKHEDSDSSLPSGSRKSLPVKNDSSDKKKKKASPMKRRRT